MKAKASTPSKSVEKHAEPVAAAKAVPAKSAASTASAPSVGKDIARVAASLQAGDFQTRRVITLTPEQEARRDHLHRMLMTKRQEVLKEIGGNLGQSVTEDQQQRLESAKDIGDQASMDLEREVDISLMEMRNRKRQMIDEAMTRLAEGTYGICAECGVDISEKRLAVVPFAKLCVECQARTELLEKIEKEEDRD
ncbi:MAG: TraR/DksA C4-type zinc finger protein [Nitrospiraceae bacterium]